MSGPMDGTLVVDLTRALAGPHAAMMLGDLGARVIKVESPGSGDDTRGWGPPFVAGGRREAGVDVLPVDEQEQGVDRPRPQARTAQATLSELVRRADVLLENFRPGTLDRLGFGRRLAARNPRLVDAGHQRFRSRRTGGWPGRVRPDRAGRGRADVAHRIGAGRPQRVGVPIGDLLAGMYGAYGVLAALLERERTGRGQVVRTSLLAAIVGCTRSRGRAWTVAGEVGRAQGNHHPSIRPYGLFHCADGACRSPCGNEGLWRRLCAEFGLDPEAPEWRRTPIAWRTAPEVIAALEGEFADHRRGPARPAREVGIPAGQVRTLDEVYGWEQTRSQGLLVDVERATLGRCQLPSPPLRFFDARPGRRAETTRRDHVAPPVLGADGDAIRAWLTAATASPSRTATTSKDGHAT